MFLELQSPGSQMQGKKELAPTSQIGKLRPRGVAGLAQGHKVRPPLFLRDAGCPAWKPELQGFGGPFALLLR